MDNAKHMPTCNPKDCLGNFFFTKNEFNYRSPEEIAQQEQEELRREELVQKLEQE